MLGSHLIKSWSSTQGLSSVYGDDFTTTGSKEDLDLFKEQLEKRYELVESARLGPGDNDDKVGDVDVR